MCWESLRTGFLREKAKKFHLGYTIKYTKSKEFRNEVNNVMHLLKKLKVEVGLLFLADSLAKTDTIILAETDKEIDKLTPKVKKEIEGKKIKAGTDKSREAKTCQHSGS